MVMQSIHFAIDTNALFDCHDQNVGYFSISWRMQCKTFTNIPSEYFISEYEKIVKSHDAVHVRDIESLCTACE